MPNGWKDAFVACQIETLGVVKSTNNINITRKPNESVVLSGIVNNCKQTVSAITETSKGASSSRCLSPGCQDGNKWKESKSFREDI